MSETRSAYTGVSEAIIPATIIAAALLICAWLLGRALARVKGSDELIHVMGSARKTIHSDFIIWTGHVTQEGTDVGHAYPQLQAQVAKIKSYLLHKGIKAAEIVPTAINVKTLYAPTKAPAGAAVADESDSEGVYRKVMSYELTQDIEVRSDNVELVDSISRQSTELISQGVAFESKPPMYLYTKLSDLKVSMQAEAARDARARAEQIALSSGSQLGSLRFARMEVPDITPLYSDRGDNGVDDTTSKDKMIKAVVVAGYSIN